MLFLPSPLNLGKMLLTLRVRYQIIVCSDLVRPDFPSNNLETGKIDPVFLRGNDD